MTEKEIVTAYRDAICYGSYMGSIYDYMQILGIKKKQRKKVVEYISRLRKGDKK